MARVTPQQGADRWNRRTKAATSDYADGIRSVTTAPGAAAAAQADRMVQGVQRAVDSGKWQDRVSSVTLPEWQQAAIEKGVGRIAAGVDGATNKYQSYLNEALPFMDNLRSQIDSRNPRGDLEQNIQRSADFQRGMAEFGNQRRGRG